MNSPLIQQEGDCKQLKLRFDVSQYKPEEIVVKTVDNKLLVRLYHFCYISFQWRFYLWWKVKSHTLNARPNFHRYSKLLDSFGIITFVFIFSMAVLFLMKS